MGAEDTDGADSDRWKLVWWKGWIDWHIVEATG